MLAFTVTYVAGRAATTGKCTDSQDQKLLPNIVNYLQQCGSMDPTTLADCLIADGFTSGCTGCLVDYAKCAMTCQGDESCIESQCEPAAKQCSGIDIPKDSLLAVTVTSGMEWNLETAVGQCKLYNDGTGVTVWVFCHGKPQRKWGVGAEGQQKALGNCLYHMLRGEGKRMCWDSTEAPTRAPTASPINIPSSGPVDPNQPVDPVDPPKGGPNATLAIFNPRAIVLRTLAVFNGRENLETAVGQCKLYNDGTGVTVWVFCHGKPLRKWGVGAEGQQKALGNCMYHMLRGEGKSMCWDSEAPTGAPTASPINKPSSGPVDPNKPVDPVDPPKGGPNATLAIFNRQLTTGGKCTDSQDMKLLPNIENYLQQCGSMDPTTLADCLITDGFTSGCTGCLVDYAKCAMTCKGDESCIASQCDPAAEQCSGIDIPKAASDSLLSVTSSLTSGQCNDSDQAMFSELGKDVQYCYQDGSMGGKTPSESQMSVCLASDGFSLPCSKCFAIVTMNCVVHQCPNCMQHADIKTCLMANCSLCMRKVDQCAGNNMSLEQSLPAPRHQVE